MGLPLPDGPPDRAAEVLAEVAADALVAAHGADVVIAVARVFERLRREPSSGSSRA